jgi:hypothetical protein
MPVSFTAISTWVVSFFAETATLPPSEQVDLGPGRQGGQLREEVEGLEDEVGRPRSTAFGMTLGEALCRSQQK